MWFQKEQPAIPSNVELFLEIERGRCAAELNDLHTTEYGRPFLDDAMEFAMTTAAELLDQPNEDTANTAAGGALTLQIAFGVNSVFENLSKFPEFAACSRRERSTRTSYVETCSAIGELIMHGLKIERWHEYHAAADLSPDNIVAFGIASILGVVIGEGRKDARHAAHVLKSTRRLAEVH